MSDPDRKSAKIFKTELRSNYTKLTTKLRNFRRQDKYLIIAVINPEPTVQTAE